MFGKNKKVKSTGQRAKRFRTLCSKLRALSGV